MASKIRRILFITAFILVSSALIAIWFHSYREYRKKIGFAEKEISFKSDGLNIVGHVYIPYSKRPFPTIILSHGANVLGHSRLIYREMSKRFAKRGYFVLSFDYRGYGDSQDPPKIEKASDLDFIQDLLNGTSFLLEKYGKDISEINLVGHSFGAGVSIGAGVKDERIHRIVAISPGRRAKELFFDPRASLGKKWIQKRMTGDMKLNTPVPLDLIEESTIPNMIDTYVDHYFNKPILLIDGSLEDKKDIAFLKNIFKKMKGNKSYITIEGAHHYFGATKYSTVENPELLEKLINVIDTWIKTN